MSSTEKTEEGSDVVCANCGIGIAKFYFIKLEECDGCDHVKYCSNNCKEAHRKQREETRKTRAVILHDKRLFRQPDGGHLGECPLCFLPLPLAPEKTTFKSCCSKIVCDGCCYAHLISKGGDRCPFCRELAPGDDEDNNSRTMKRIKAGDPLAMREMGTALSLEGDYDGAFEYWTKAAELGDVGAHYQLSCSYMHGAGVKKDEEKEVYHLEKAAIGGHAKARYNLGWYEEENGNIERAAKHFIIAANLGYEKSMEVLREYYTDGNITKDDLEATRRTHKAAIDAMKSPQREEAYSKWD
jgi:hypothetical protein